MAGPGSVDRGERLENETIYPWTHNLNNSSWEPRDRSWGQGTSPSAVTSTLIPDMANSIINITGSINFNTTAIPPTPDDEAALSGLQLFGIVFGSLMALFLVYLALMVWYLLHQCVIDCNSAACEANVRGPVLRGASRCQKVLGCFQAWRWICCCGYCWLEKRSADSDIMQETSSSSGENRSALDRVADQLGASMLSFTRFFHRHQRSAATRNVSGFQSHQSRREDSRSEVDPEQPDYTQLFTPPSMFRDTIPTTRSVNSGTSYSPLPSGPSNDLLKSFRSKMSRTKREGDGEMSVFLESDLYSEDSTFLRDDTGYLATASLQKSLLGASAQLTILGNDEDDEPHVVMNESDVPLYRSQTYSLLELSRASVKSNQQDRFSLEDHELPLLDGKEESGGTVEKCRSLRPSVGTENLRGMEFSSDCENNDSIDNDSNLDPQAYAERACVVVEITSSEKHTNPTSSLWTGDTPDSSPVRKSASCHTLDERASRGKRKNNLHDKAETISVQTSAYKEPLRERVIPNQDPSSPQSEVVVQVYDHSTKNTEVSNQLLAEEQKSSPDKEIASSNGSAENTSGYSEMSETEPNDSSNLSSLCKHHSRFHSYPSLGEKSFTMAEDKKAQTNAVLAGRAMSSEVLNRGKDTPATRYPPGSRNFRRSPVMGVSSKLRAATSLELPGAQVTDHGHCVKCFPQNQSSIHCSQKLPEVSQASASRESVGHPLLNVTYTIHRPETTSSAESGTEESPQHEMSSHRRHDLKKTEPSNAGKAHDKALDNINQSVTKNEQLPVDTSTCDSKSDSHPSLDLPSSNPSSEQHVPKIMSSVRRPQTNASTNTQTNTFRDNLVKKYKDQGSFFQLLVNPYLRLPTSTYPASARSQDSTVSQTERQSGNVTRDLTTVHNVVDRQLREAPQSSSQAQTGTVNTQVSVPRPSPDETATDISSQSQETSDSDLD